jgi:hypothetical protein
MGIKEHNNIISSEFMILMVVESILMQNYYIYVLNLGPEMVVLYVDI